MIGRIIENEVKYLNEDIYGYLRIYVSHASAWAFTDKHHLPTNKCG